MSIGLLAPVSGATQDEGGNPVTSYVENGYVAAEALSSALARLPGGTIVSSELMNALHLAEIVAPRGYVTFDSFGQVVNDVYVRRVRAVGGRYQNERLVTYPRTSQF